MPPEPTKPTKAVWAGFVALAGGLATALVDNDITLAEGAAVFATVVAAAAGVYGITNKPRDL